MLRCCGVQGVGLDLKKKKRWGGKKGCLDGGNKGTLV